MWEVKLRREVTDDAEAAGTLDGSAAAKCDVADARTDRAMGGAKAVRCAAMRSAWLSGEEDGDKCSKERGDVQKVSVMAEARAGRGAVVQSLGISEEEWRRGK